MIFDFLFNEFGGIAFAFFLIFVFLLALALIVYIIAFLVLSIKVWRKSKIEESYDPSWMDRKKWEENQE